VRHGELPVLWLTSRKLGSTIAWARALREPACAVRDCMRACAYRRACGGALEAPTQRPEPKLLEMDAMDAPAGGEEMEPAAGAALLMQTSCALSPPARGATKGKMPYTSPSRRGSSLFWLVCWRL
jgi:hypothetical protein